MMMYHPIKFGCKRISSSVDMVKTVIFDYVEPYCNLGLKIVNQSFCMTLSPMMMNHQTKFGYKRFSSSGDIWTNIH